MVHSWFALVEEYLTSYIFFVRGEMREKIFHAYLHFLFRPASCHLDFALGCLDLLPPVRKYPGPLNMFGFRTSHFFGGHGGR